MAVARPAFPLAGLLVLPGILWLVLFAVAPFGFLICMSLWTTTIFGIEHEWTLDNYRTITADTVYILIMLKTVRIAAVSTVLSLLVSYPIAWFLASRAGRSKARLLFLLFLPFWTSYLVRSFMWLPILGRSGLVNTVLVGSGLLSHPLDILLFNEGAVYLGLVYVYTLFMVLPIYLALDRLDGGLLEAASDLGARPVQVFRRVIFPLSLPGVWSGCTMVFLLSAGAYVTPQLLGGASGIMVGNVIASQFLESGNWPLGAALSVVLIVIVLIAVALAGWRLGLQQLFLGQRA
jgi:spermidine/putrescine transport system permease protein